MVYKDKEKRKKYMRRPYQKNKEIIKERKKKFQPGGFE